MLISLLTAVLLLVALYYIIGLIPDERVKKVLHVVVLVLVIIWVIKVLLGTGDDIRVLIY